MNRIRLLPEQVANQIAAGEVVERPASVVKELVENSLDAGAARLTVEIQAGGRSLVRVTDDGTGMSRDDALLCLERHATSKIQRAEDLQSIATLGFRGEALPSIASVSRFTLTTRERESDSPEGTQVVINGGKIVEVKAAGAATGTVLEVRSLFFNLPARRKFLRAEETEAAHIQHYLTLAALAHPQVAFTFVKDGRTLWQLPAVKSSGDTAVARTAALRERWRALHGDQQRLIAVEHTETFQEQFAADDLADSSATRDPQSAIRLWGLMGAPGVSRATRDEQHVFVNRRPVENRGLNFALLEGYHTALMKGRFPVCCLFLEIDPAAVDVNVHPAKREVKFRDERAVRGFVARAVREALLAFHAPPSVSAPANTSPSPLIERDALMPSFEPRESALPGMITTPARPTPVPDCTVPLPLGFRHETAAAHPPAARPRVPQTPPNLESQISNLQYSAAPAPLLSVPLRLVGVIGKLYVVLESDRGLVLLDQHAAHERILFEQMLTRLERNEITAQRLLLPETIELGARDAMFVRGVLPTLTRLGVGLSEFGERTFLLDALPPMVKAPDARGFVIGLIDELKAAGEGVNTLRLGEDVITKTVCRHSVKANDPLAGAELENLVNDLRRCAMPYTCPHGRPTLIEMNFRELEKKFGRAQ